jgi:hypothetical protein
MHEGHVVWMTTAPPARPIIETGNQDSTAGMKRREPGITIMTSPGQVMLKPGQLSLQNNTLILLTTRCHH